MSVALVIEPDPAHDLRRLGEWLTEAGLSCRVTRPYAGDPVPGDLTGYAALVVLGGGTPGGEEEAAVGELLRAAVRDGSPALAIGAGARLLARAHGGTVAPAGAGPAAGPALVARRDAAGMDPLFARVPFTPDVIQWHQEEIVTLPPGAVLLAASTHYPHQAFRLGTAAWGLQFHIEPDPDQLARWAAAGEELLRELGRDPDRVVADAAAVMDEIAEAWQPFAVRFAALTRGELPAADLPQQRLPLLGE